MESKDGAKTEKEEMLEVVLAVMIEGGDLKSFYGVFQAQEEMWDMRERVVLALICRSNNGVDYDKSEMIKTLKDISQVCKAERTGGTYRTACLENVQLLLEKLGEQPLPTAEERDVSAKKPTSSSDKRIGKISHLLILIEKMPTQGSTWLKTVILDKLAPEAGGQPYRYYVDSETKIEALEVGKQDFSDWKYISMAASMQFMITWDYQPDLDKLRWQPFAGQIGNGAVIQIHD